MSDPRNVAHDKKVIQEKKHHGEEITPGAIHTPQPGKKMAVKHEKHEQNSSGNETEPEAQASVKDGE